MYICIYICILGTIFIVAQFKVTAFGFNFRQTTNVKSQQGFKSFKMMTDSLIQNEEPIEVLETIPNKVEKQFSSSTVSSVNLLKNMLGM
jgi:hypothetical protein